MNKTYFSKLLIISSIVWLVAGCDLNKNDDTKPVDKYLVSFEKHKTYLPAFIKSLLTPLVEDYPELQTIADNVKHGVDVYKITYITKFDGQELLASGLVSVPVDPGTYPVISYQNGTNTLNSNAPSVNPNYELYLLLEFMAAPGFVVSVPDYLGFGASKSMFHPYLDKTSTVQSVTDMLRAVDEFVDHYLDIETNDDLYITGYSQGGWATMQLQKAIELELSDEFKLKASACGAGPYDLNLVNDYILAQATYPMPYYMGYIFNSYIKMGDITILPSEIFKSPYDGRILTLYDGTKSGDEINAQLTTKTFDLFTAAYISGSKTDPKFASVFNSLKNNSVTAWKTNIPTLIMHGTDDNYVPPSTSANIYNGFVAQGVSPTTVTYLPIPGAGHSTGIIPAGVAAFNWFIGMK